MDINNVAAKTASMLSQQRVGDAVGVSVQKKALQIQSQGAATLINSVPKAESTSSSNPPNLGQNLDVKA